MTETKQIFVGGWVNTGTRLIVQLLQKKKYDSPGFLNYTLDYMGPYFLPIMGRIFDNGCTDISELNKYIHTDIQNSDKWVIKHGHLILIIPQLKQLYPNSKFIICIRHPLDILYKDLQDMNVVINFGPKNKITNRYRTIEFWYDQLFSYISENGDKDILIVKLEDLVSKEESEEKGVTIKEQTIKKIYDFINCDNTVTQDILDIINEPSTTIGQGVMVAKKLGY